MNIENSSNVNSAYKTEIFINNFNVGSGIYEVYYSSLDGAPVGGHFWNSFTKNLTPGGSSWSVYDGWTGTGMYASDKFLELNAKGEWVFIKSLIPFVINRIFIYSNLSGRNAVAVGILYGSNDGINWNIISELDIIPFLSELPYDYFVKFIVDDVLLQMNLMHNKKNNTDIYRNPQHDKKPYYKLIQTDTENEIYHICRYIEQNFY